MSHFVLTGPIEGNVILDDGTEIDVTPGMIQVANPDIGAQVAHKIGLRYRKESHPKVEGQFQYIENPGA